MTLEELKHVGMVKYIALILILCSCSATHHLNKFYKKGGKIENTTVQVTVQDTVQVNGKDSIVIRKVNVECPEPVIQTRWKTRFEYKRFNDSLKTVRTQYKDSLRYALRSYKNTLKNDLKTARSNDRTKRVETRQENKRSLWWLFYILGAFTMVLIYFGIKYLKAYLFIK